MDEGKLLVSVKKWAAQVRQDHGSDTKFWNDKTHNRIIARKDNEIVGSYDRKANNGTVFSPEQDAEFNGDLDSKGKFTKDTVQKMFGKTYPNCVKNTNEEQGVAEAESLEDKIKELKDYISKQERVLGGGNALSTQERKFLAQARKELKQLTSKNKKVMEESCPHCGGEMVSEELMNEKKDACYYKVKSRYKVWPSAYASGALVKCRKKGAKNWGTKSESSIMRGIQNEQSTQESSMMTTKNVDTSKIVPGATINHGFLGQLKVVKIEGTTVVAKDPRGKEYRISLTSVK